jgi:hypothetical protein
MNKLSLNEPNPHAYLRVREVSEHGKAKPKAASNLSCRYCAKTLKNENARSGHMKSCSKRQALHTDFRKKNDQIFGNPITSKKHWDSLDHAYFELFDHEVRYSVDALDFIKGQTDVMSRFPQERLEKFCVFYLIVLAQIADKKAVRQQAHTHLSSLLNVEDLACIHHYWPSLGGRRYEPTAESYTVAWTKFVRIKDDCFFYVDYPTWVLLLDRYILTYKHFGWTQNKVHKEEKYFMDMVLFNIRQILYLEQDCIDLPASQCYQSEVPLAAIPFLHRNSRARFSAEDSQWKDITNIGYDPTDPASAILI